MSGPRAIVFDAGKIKYDIITLPKKDRLGALQKLVGGRIEHLVHSQSPDEASFQALANEEGVNINLPSNFVAWGTLMELGFQDTSLIPGAFAGNIVLLGKKGRTLTDKDLVTVERAYRRYLKNIGEEDQDEEASRGLKRARDESEPKKVKTV
jgi:hypothetical protein